MCPHLNNLYNNFKPKSSRFGRVNALSDNGFSPHYQGRSLKPALLATAMIGRCAAGTCAAR